MTKDIVTPVSRILLLRLDHFRPSKMCKLVVTTLWWGKQHDFAKIYGTHILLMHHDVAKGWLRRGGGEYAKP